MSTQIVEYSATEAALADLAQRYHNVVFDVTTTPGMTLARKGRAEIRILRTALEAKRVEIKAPALERCRLIDAEAKRITAELLALETPIDALIKNEEQRKERERLEKEQAERDRVEKIQRAIASFALSVASCSNNRSASWIANAIVDIESCAIDEKYAEFQSQAQAAKEEALLSMHALHAAQVEHEAEQERIKAERAELARLRAEQEQRAKEEQARIAEEIRKRAEAEAAARAEVEAMERAARARIDKEERAARLLREEEDRKARADREAEDARRRAESARIEAAVRAVEAEQRKLREAEEARQREILREQQEVMDAWTMLETFKSRFGKRREFAKVIAAINAAIAAREQDLASQA